MSWKLVNIWQKKLCERIWQFISTNDTWIKKIMLEDVPLSERCLVSFEGKPLFDFLFAVRDVTSQTLTDSIQYSIVNMWVIRREATGTKVYLSNWKSSQCQLSHYRHKQKECWTNRERTFGNFSEKKEMEEGLSKTNL